MDHSTLESLRILWADLIQIHVNNCMVNEFVTQVWFYLAALCATIAVVPLITVCMYRLKKIEDMKITQIAADLVHNYSNKCCFDVFKQTIILESRKINKKRVVLPYRNQGCEAAKL